MVGDAVSLVEVSVLAFREPMGDALQLVSRVA